ncbi:MAG: hypothetical protein ACREJO_13350 [Phycisphaerales bacterium]
MNPAVLDLSHSRTVVKDGKRIYLVKVAYAQRSLIFLVLAALVLYGGLIVATVYARGTGGPLTLLECVLGVSYIAVVIATIVQTVRLSIAAGGNSAVAIASGIIMLVPCVGVLVMLAANQRATTILQKQGARVGLFGVPAGEMTKLIEGACPGCGYDIRDLPSSTCPECGAALAPPTAAPSNV